MQFVASRPKMPGYGLAGEDEGTLLDWSWAEQRLKRSRRYWLSTVRPDGMPHTMPVWGVWWRDCFYFSTGMHSRKARNLGSNPACTVATERAEEAVVVEGTSCLVAEPQRGALAAAYEAKYDGGYPADSHVYQVTPRVVFGLIEASADFTNCATKWTPQGDDQSVRSTCIGSIAAARRAGR